MNAIADNLEQAIGRLSTIKGLPDDEYKSRIEAERRAETRARARDLIEKSNAPNRHLASNLTISGPWAERLAMLRTRVGTGFLVALTGVRGNGKTQIGVELIRHATNNGRSGLFATATEFFIAVKASYGKDATETEAEVITHYRYPALLVLDEVGKRGETMWENNLLFELINKRYNDMSDTLLIDNNTGDEFRTMIGPSLASRMNEAGGIIECDWESFRQ